MRTQHELTFEVNAHTDVRSVRRRRMRRRFSVGQVLVIIYPLTMAQLWKRRVSRGARESTV